MSDRPTQGGSNESFDPPANVLCFDPSGDPQGEGNCVGLLERADPSRTDVLFVSVTESPGEQLRRWRSHFDAPPANVGVVSVADQVRSAASANGGPTSLGGVPVETVSDPSDLTGIGIAVAEYLSRWQETGNRVVVCFRSLTALLQYAEFERAYRFLNELTAHLDRAGAVAHFHVAEGGHDERQLDTLASLFDGVVGRSGDAGPGATRAAGTMAVEGRSADERGDGGPVGEDAGFVFPAADETDETSSPDPEAASGTAGESAPEAESPATAAASQSAVETAVETLEAELERSEPESDEAAPTRPASDPASADADRTGPFRDRLVGDDNRWSRRPVAVAVLCLLLVGGTLSLVTGVVAVPPGVPVPGDPGGDSPSGGPHESGLVGGGVPNATETATVAERTVTASRTAAPTDTASPTRSATPAPTPAPVPTPTPTESDSSESGGGFLGGGTPSATEVTTSVGDGGGTDTEDDSGSVVTEVSELTDTPVSTPTEPPTPTESGGSGGDDGGLIDGDDGLVSEDDGLL